MAISGLVQNAVDSNSTERGTSSGGSVGGGSSDNWSTSYGGTYGTGANASAFSYQMMKEANKFNAEQARLNRTWQEKMSNTGYQRAMKDLRKAGLNPILAYTNGPASTTQGATASSAMGSTHTDSYNKSESKGHSSEYNKSWNNSEHTGDSKSTTNFVNQASAITGALADAISSIAEGIGFSSSGSGTFRKKVDSFFGKKETPKVTTTNGTWKSK